MTQLHVTNTACSLDLVVQNPAMSPQRWECKSRDRSVSSKRQIAHTSSRLGCGTREGHLEPIPSPACGWQDKVLAQLTALSAAQGSLSGRRTDTLAMALQGSQSRELTWSSPELAGGSAHSGDVRHVRSGLVVGAWGWLSPSQAAPCVFCPALLRNQLCSQIKL